MKITVRRVQFYFKILQNFKKNSLMANLIFYL